jgi:hypothetical protein
MHLIGSWHPLTSSTPDLVGNFPFIDLRISDAVTVLEDNRRKLIFEGIIFDATDQQLLDDPTLLDRAFGYYTYILFEKESQTVYFGADRLGFSPVYHAWEGKIFRFSSSLTLLKYELGNVTPNLDAWDEHLVLDDILGDKTVVKEITRLRWGRKFRMTADRVDTVDIWDPEFPAFTDKQTYIRLNNELLIEAMHLTRSSERRKFVMLSGGEDSRRLAIAAHHVGLPFTCVTQNTIGKEASDKDVLVAEAVCQSLGVPHICVPQPSHRDILNDAITEDYWLGYEGGQHEWILPLMRRLPQDALVYDGIIADVTVNGHFFHTYPQLLTRFDDLDYAARLICGAIQSGIDPKQLSAPLFERVRAELARYPASPHRLTYYFLLNHTRRCIGSWFTLFYLLGHKPALPYIYYPFFVQSLSLDPRHYLEAWMQNECMKQMNAATAAIPSTRNKVPASLVIDLKSAARARARFTTRHLRIRRDAVRYLPGLARTRRTYKALSLLGLGDRAGKWSWAPRYLARFSRFLDWIEDRQGPDFPVKRATTALLQRHFVS